VGLNDSITYSVVQTLDNLGHYKEIGPSFKYIQPTPVQLTNDPITTDGSTGVVDLTVPSTVGLSIGNIITITGVDETVGGITEDELNITAIITAIVSGTVFSYATSGTSSSATTGGGPNVSYYFPALPTSFEIDGDLTDATTSQIYSFQTPATAFQCIVSDSDEGELTLNILQAGI
jgi:hypothetical protein